MTAATPPFTLQMKPGGPLLHVRSFTGEEAVSKLFRFRLLADADPHIPIPTSQLLGQNVTFVIELGRHERRFLATIASVDELGVDEHRALYGLELVPRLWAMTRTVRSRVFEGLDPLSIIDQVFVNSGVQIKAQPRAEDRVRPYCVQYFESDFDFAVRLLEEEGYIYRYEADRENPIFAITYLPSLFPTPNPKLGLIPFYEMIGAPEEPINSFPSLPEQQFTPVPSLFPKPKRVAFHGAPEERITSWRNTRILTATRVSARDHFFEAEPSPVLEGTASVTDQGLRGWETLAASWSAPVDRYPGQWAHLFEEVLPGGADNPLSGYLEFGDSRALSDLHQVAGSTSASEGASNSVRMMPGRVFDLFRHPTSSGEHFVVSVRHKGSRGLDFSSGGADEFSYENQFTSVPFAATVMYLPPRSTRKPLIHGCQTAKVVGGAAADEISTDKYGRVQVQFWWDRGSTRSCWIRVATSWAGSHWGVQHIPRVGQEVVVTFLDGDPDRPLIVGSVYNPTHMPPFDLPTNKTQSGIRTHSTPGGGADDSNEICFEDKEGAEEIYIHAQRDRTSVVENDSTEVVGNDSSETVINDRTVKVQHNRTDNVKNNFYTTTDGEKHEAIKLTSTLKVSGDCMNSFDQKLGINAKEIHLKADKIVIEAGRISIKTGGNFIHLENGGITIDSKGGQVWVNCGGAKSPDDGCFTEPVELKSPFHETGQK